MGRKHCPGIRIVVKTESYAIAERVLKNLSEEEGLAQTNLEKKYERNEMNGEVREDGYIKLSLNHERTGTRIYGAYSGDELKIRHTDNANREIPDFMEAADIFRDCVYPAVTQVVDEDLVDMSVTSMSV